MIGWPEVFRLLAERYGWTPAQILDLTLVQAAMFLGARTADDPPTILLTEEQYHRFIRASHA